MTPAEHADSDMSKAEKEANALPSERLKCGLTEGGVSGFGLRETLQSEEHEPTAHATSNERQKCKLRESGVPGMVVKETVQCEEHEPTANASSGRLKCALRKGGESGLGLRETLDSEITAGASSGRLKCDLGREQSLGRDFLGEEAEPTRQVSFPDWAPEPRPRVSVSEAQVCSPPDSDPGLRQSSVGGLLGEVQPPEIEDAGLEDCALPTWQILVRSLYSQAQYRTVLYRTHKYSSVLIQYST